jgi:hypothetical protein
MSTLQLLEQLRHLSNPERLELIEAATRLIREDLASQSAVPASEQERRLRTAADRVKDLYEGHNELTEWTVLDAEDVADDYLQR